ETGDRSRNGAAGSREFHLQGRSANWLAQRPDRERDGRSRLAKAGRTVATCRRDKNGCAAPEATRGYEKEHLSRGCGRARRDKRSRGENCDRANARAPGLRGELVFGLPLLGSGFSPPRPRPPGATSVES